MKPLSLDQYRFFLKDSIRQTIDFSETPQHRGLPPPPLQKPCAPGTPHTALPAPSTFGSLPARDLREAIAQRESRREFLPAPLTLEELSFLLWATQGIRRQLDHGTALRTVPSAGARHALESYVCPRHVTTLEPAVYRYLPLTHELAAVRGGEHLSRRLTDGALGQSFVGSAAAVFVWTAIPARMEWRYGLAAHKVILLDAGHVCQNLYLACEAIGAGTCAVAAYDQEGMDRILGVDGHEEFTIYLAPVGKVRA
jgi:SagB-type dehydrogenase family enzyme